MTCRRFAQSFSASFAVLRAARSPAPPRGRTASLLLGSLLLASFVLAAPGSTAAAEPAAAPAPVSCRVRVVHAFAPDGADGTRPGDGLVQYARGHLLGVTTGGGSFGYGTVFDLALDGSETIVHDFAGGAGDGADPTAPPTPAADGILYGTTQLGGAHGLGTVYRLGASGSFGLLHSFSGHDGANPDAPLLAARDGALYGTTLLGGRHGQGTLFRVSAAGVFELLHEFGAPGDLRQPAGALAQGEDGALYGAAAQGGNGDAGGVFAYAPRSSVERVLVSLRDFSDCRLPMAGVVRAPDGRLLGTAYAGGPANAGCVFAVVPDGDAVVLYALRGEDDGAQPLSLPLPDAQGRLLLTSSLGAAHGDGALLALDAAAGGATVLHAFGRADVSVPSGRLLQGSDGCIRGTAPYGAAYDEGGVFEAC